MARRLSRATDGRDTGSRARAYGVLSLVLGCLAGLLTPAWAWVLQPAIYRSLGHGGFAGLWMVFLCGTALLAVTAAGFSIGAIRGREWLLGGVGLALAVLAGCVEVGYIALLILLSYR